MKSFQFASKNTKRKKLENFLIAKETQTQQSIFLFALNVRISKL